MTQSNQTNFLPRNVLGLLRLTVLTIDYAVLGGLLSGCHPCSIPGVCNAMVIEVFAYVNDKGDIYFDIPDRKNYKRTELYSFGVSKVNDEGFADPVWGMERPYWTPEGKLVVTDYIPLPLRYGQNITGTKVYGQPKALNNGLYQIDGSIFVYGKGHFRLTGHFSYENGAVKD